MNFIGRIGMVVGIDPDIGKNGVAAINRGNRSLVVKHLNFPETLEWVKELYADWKQKYGQTNPGSFMVYVEAGWLNRGNWHVQGSRNGKMSPSAWAAAVGTGLGECNGVSKKLIECFEYYGVPVTAQRPLKKCWKGPDRKITHEELLQELEIYKVQHNIRGKSNPETRDAALLALVNL